MYETGTFNVLYRPWSCSYVEDTRVAKVQLNDYLILFKYLYIYIQANNWILLGFHRRKYLLRFVHVNVFVRTLSIFR